VNGSRVGGLSALAVVGITLLVAAIALPRPAAELAPASTPAAAAASRVPTAVAPETAQVASTAADDGFLVVLDFLPQVAEEVEVDPIEGHPDSDELRPFLGEPTVFGAAVANAGATTDGAITRCGAVRPETVRAIAAALNDRLATDQRVDPTVVESRTLLHWHAAEGYASLRIFAIGPTHRPSCARAADLS
jgi:hypothetical protein